MSNCERLSVSGILHVMVIVLCYFSVMFVLIHFYKFYNSKSPQKFATKFLTVYCLNLFVIYVFLLHTTTNFPQIPVWCGYYLCLTIPFWKFLMAIDICVCFRNTALYLERSKKSQNLKLFGYCVMGAVVPLILASPVLYLELSKNCLAAYSLLLWTVTGIRLVRMVPFALALWYLKKARMNEADFRTNFALHMRLLVVMGGLSSMLDFADSIILVIGLNDFVGAFFRDTINAGISAEGVIIAACFTFKKDTFRSAAQPRVGAIGSRDCLEKEPELGSDLLADPGVNGVRD